MKHEWPVLQHKCTSLSSEETVQFKKRGREVVLMIYILLCFTFPQYNIFSLRHNQKRKEKKKKREQKTKQQPHIHII